MPLGYRLVERKLLIDETEAATVRLIFERYLELGSIGALLQDLSERGIVTRRRTLATGRTIGGVPFTRGPLAHLLKNRMYLGELNHGSNSYPAEHSPLIPKETFEAVKARLAAQAAASGYNQSKSEALLQGKLFDDRGHRMTPSFAVKGGVRYRYYVSRATTEGRRAEAGAVTRVPAADVERVVVEAIANLGLSHGGQAEATGGAVQGLALSGDRSAGGDRDSGASDIRLVQDHVERITIRADAIEINLAAATAALARASTISAPWTKPAFRVHREILAPAEGSRKDPRAMSFDTRSRLLAAIGKARRWLGELTSGRARDIEALAAREGRSERSLTMLLSLAFVEPDLVKAIVKNRMPRGIGLTRMTDLPGEWDGQRRVLGLAADAHA